LNQTIQIFESDEAINLQPKPNTDLSQIDYDRQYVAVTDLLSANLTGGTGESPFPVYL
jgi:hypothetical protein